MTDYGKPSEQKRASEREIHRQVRERKQKRAKQLAAVEARRKINYHNLKRNKVVFAHPPEKVKQATLTNFNSSPRCTMLLFAELDTNFTARNQQAGKNTTGNQRGKDL